MTGQHRQQHGAEQVALGWGIGAGQPERAVRHPGVEQAGLLQVVDEERKLARRRDRGLRVPFDMDTAGECVRDGRPWLNLRLLTLRVNYQTLLFCAHGGGLCRFGRRWQSVNCRI